MSVVPLLTPAEDLYPVLFACAGWDAAPEGPMRWMVRVHDTPIEQRTGTEQLLFCRYWMQLCERLFKRNATTARQAPLQICLPWYTPRPRYGVQSYACYQLGQLITLERKFIFTVLSNLSVHVGGGGGGEAGVAYMGRACVAKSLGVTLCAQINAVIYQVYCFLRAEYNSRLWSAVLADVTLSSHWDLFVQQYHMLRVLFMWLKAVMILQEMQDEQCMVCTACEREMTHEESTTQKRQNALDNMATLCAIVGTHIMGKNVQCVDPNAFGGPLQQITTGARIESILCRAEFFQQTGDTETASWLYAYATKQYNWKQTPQVLKLHETEEERSGTETMNKVDMLDLLSREPAGKEHLHWNLTGQAQPYPGAVTPETPWDL